MEQLDTFEVHHAMANRRIIWKFNPPLAPHFGGVHEVMVRAAKRALRAILGTATVNDEELGTAFTGAEALINSRPLTYQSANPEDTTPLTPNHFLFGQAAGDLAPTVSEDVIAHPQRRWRHVQTLISHFWHRWQRVGANTQPTTEVAETAARSCRG